MQQMFRFSRCFVSSALFLALFGLVAPVLYAQRVDTKNCPTNYFRNNGNGQSVSVFAPNILPTGIYFRSALQSGNTGNFTFKWDAHLQFPPVITRTWVTTTGGVTTPNWVFGSNATGSPFNPPGVPVSGEVKYTFYYNNLPTAGVVTLELSDPADGSYVNTCSYPLSSGASSSGVLTSFAIAAPSAFSYPGGGLVAQAGKSGKSAVPDINAAGGTISYSMPNSVDGITVESNTGIVSWTSQVPEGSYDLIIRASNGTQPDATTSFYLTLTGEGVGSGNDGGLESKSLGMAIADRVYKAGIQNNRKSMRYDSVETLNQARARRTSADIRQFMPDEKYLAAGITGFISSPRDILSFTNAIDVVSVDYVFGGINQAVAFCTKTIRGIYTHTKPVCDRLKGAELKGVDTISSGGYRFLRYRLKPAAGPEEFALSFSAGANEQEQKFVLQSEWMTDHYSTQETMFNFQLWSANPRMLERMLSNVLQKLAAEMPVEQRGAVKKPVCFITRATRDSSNQHQLLLHIRNAGTAAGASILVEGKANEQAQTIIRKTYPVSLAPAGEKWVSIPLKDMAEAEIRLLINGITEDFVYSNDGVWNYYKTPATNITSFTISNDTTQPRAGEYRLFRNVKLNAITADYVTVYRMVKGGGVPADLRQYQQLKFSASGNGMVRIRLMKKSVTRFADQYDYLLALTPDMKPYDIPLSAFRSSATSAPISLNDIEVVSFTYESTGSQTTVNTILEQVRFARKEITINLPENRLDIYPNPTRSQVTASFTAPASGNAIITLTEVSNGRQVFLKNAPVVTGSNNISLSLSAQISAGVYLLRVQLAGKLMEQKVMVW